jgi:uncharacterized membrane protein (TIGR02234 family)
MRSGLLRSILGCAVGAALVLIAQAMTWATAAVPKATGGVQHLSVRGHDIEPGLPASGYALLALALALLAARGPLRRLAGLLIAVVGATAAAAAAAGRSAAGPALLHRAFAPTVHALATTADAWWVVALAGGLLCVASGLAALVRSGGWSAGLGQRYEPARAVGQPGDPAAPDDDAAAWRALDRGEDPTG